MKVNGVSSHHPVFRGTIRVTGIEAEAKSNSRYRELILTDTNIKEIKPVGLFAESGTSVSYRIGERLQKYNIDCNANDFVNAYNAAYGRDVAIQLYPAKKV